MVMALFYKAGCFWSGYPPHFNLSFKRCTMALYPCVVLVLAKRMHSPFMMIFVGWFEVKCRYWYRFRGF